MILRKLPIIKICCIFLILLSISASYGDSVSAAKCRENRRTIAGAIEIYYIEYPETYGMITIDMLLRSGALSEMVYCPDGGEYSIGADGEVYCSVHYRDPNSEVEEESDDVEGENMETSSNSEKIEKEEKIEELPEETPFVRDDEVADNSSLEEEIDLDKFINVDKFKKSEEKLITAQDLGEIKKSGPSKFFSPIKSDKKKISDEEKLDREKPVTAHEFNERGLKYASIMKFDKAIRDFQRALDLVPDSKIYLFNLSLTYARMGNIKLAKYNIQRAKRLEPNNKRIDELYQMIMKEEE